MGRSEVSSTQSMAGQQRPPALVQLDQRRDEARLVDVQVLHQEVIFPNCVSREVVQSKRTRRGISSLIEPFSYWFLSDDEEGAALTTEAVHVVFLTREGMRRRTTQRIHVHVCLMYLVYVERSSGEQEQEPVRENGMR